MTTITTAPGIRAYHLLAARGAIWLEAMGLKHSSGRSVRKHWAVQLGMKPNAKHEDVIAKIEEKLAEIRKEMADGQDRRAEEVGKQADSVCGADAVPDGRQP